MGVRLRTRARDLKLTQERLDELTGIPRVTIQRIFAGKSAPDDERIELLAKAVDWSVDQLRYGESGGDAFVSVGIYDVQVAAGSGRIPFDEVEPVGQWLFPRPWIIRHFGGAADLRLFTVRGDSQEPELSDGDQVLIDLNAGKFGEGMHVVRLDNALLIKRVQREGARVRLKSANPAYNDIVIEMPADEGRFDVVGRAGWAGKLL